MRAPACILMMALLICCESGCALFKKSGAGSGATPGDGGGAPPPKFPGSNDPILNSSGKNPAAESNLTPARSASDDGILAGQVVQGTGVSKPPANTFIRLVNLDQKDAAPTEVAVTPDGYFTIQNLKRGGQYKLLARGKNGERMVAGITYTSAPNSRLLIRMKEDLAGADIPDVPGSPAFQGDKKPQEKEKTSQNQRPLGETELPAVNVPTPGEGGPKSGAAGIVDKSNEWPPLLNVPPLKKPPQPPLQISDLRPIDPPTKPGPAAPFTESTGPARVPSCIRVGKQIVNFALNDTQGEPWEFRANRKGKIVLLDFWWTECQPCLQTIPDLKLLHQKYSSKGLQIVGIANEQQGSFQEQTVRVQSVVNRMQIPYKQLVAGGPNCPLRTELGVTGFPTLVVLDDQGWILWSHVGRPDAAKVAELDRLIQRRLAR